MFARISLSYCNCPVLVNDAADCVARIKQEYDDDDDDDVQWFNVHLKAD